MKIEEISEENESWDDFCARTEKKLNLVLEGVDNGGLLYKHPSFTTEQVIEMALKEDGTKH